MFLHQTLNHNHLTKKVNRIFQPQKLKLRTSMFMILQQTIILLASQLHEKDLLNRHLSNSWQIALAQSQQKKSRKTQTSSLMI